MIADGDHRLQDVFGFLEMRFLLEVECVGKQCRSEQLHVVVAMRFTSRAHDAAEMGRLSPLAGKLGAIALGGRPLIAEHIGSGWLAVGSEQIDEPQCQKSSLTQTDAWGGGWFISHPLQEDGVGQARAARLLFSAHARPYVHPTCRTARPSRAPT